MTLLKIERRKAVAIVSLDRPAAMNALGQDGDGKEFRTVCDDLNADESLRCIILTGEGRAFCAGGDVKAMRDRSGAFAGGGVKIRQGYRANIHLILRALDGLDLPLIAAVNGPAIGLGCDLACLADIRIASDQALFGVTFTKLGLVPGDGGAWLLPRVIGASRAAELFYTGEAIDAAKALEWGLVGQVTPHEALMTEALALASRIAAQPPHALRLTKTLLRQARTATYDTMLEMSATAQALAHLTDDHVEGVSALIDKRAPDFKGQ